MFFKNVKERISVINDNIMLAVPVKDTLNDNLELKLYYDAKKKEYGYLGLYDDWYIRAVGKVIKVVTVEYKFNDWYFDSNVTTDEKSRIFEAMNRSKDYKNSQGYVFDKDPIKFFFVDEFYPTSYQRIGDIGILGCKKMDMAQILGTSQLDAKFIANAINGKQF